MKKQKAALTKHDQGLKARQKEVATAKLDLGTFPSFVAEALADVFLRAVQGRVGREAEGAR